MRDQRPGEVLFGAICAFAFTQRLTMGLLMTVVHTRTSTHHLPARSGYIIDGRIAWWKVHARRQAIVLTASGEIDASNADNFKKTLSRLTAEGDPLVVDLRAVDFCGVQALRALVSLDEECRESGVAWALVAGRAVNALLRIGDIGAVLPLVPSVTDALQRFESDKRIGRQLISLNMSERGS
jgi:anti-anti-sigma factor